MNRNKKLGVLTAAFVAAVGLLFVTAASDTVSADNHDPFTDGDELMVFVNILSGDSIQGGHLDGWVNEYPDGDDFSQIGGIGLVRNPDGCDELSCAEWHVGYCSESDEQIHVLEYEPYLETSIDPRLSYLTWKYGYEFYIANYASGNAIAPMVATQALVWAWHSDPETGSSVFANVAGGLDDPFNWNSLTPSLHSVSSPRVGFHGDDLNYDFTPSLDVWYHLVFTYENSGSFTKCIYVDGVLKKSGSGGKYAYSGSNKQLLIGRAYGPDLSTSRGFTGEMAYARGFTAALNSKGVEYLYSQKPDATGGVFKGLEYNEGSSTFLDGSIGHSTWYYAVGAFKEFKTRQFPGPTPDSVNLVKLWLKTDMKKMKNCKNHLDRLADVPWGKQLHKK